MVVMTMKGGDDSNNSDFADADDYCIELWKFKPTQCWGYFPPKHKNAKIFEKHLNPVMLVLIGKLSLSSFRWVPMCHGLSSFSVFLA